MKVSVKARTNWEEARPAWEKQGGKGRSEEKVRCC